jgi:hypothetical protein
VFLKQSYVLLIFLCYILCAPGIISSSNHATLLLLDRAYLTVFVCVDGAHAIFRTSDRDGKRGNNRYALGNHTWTTFLSLQPWGEK